MLDKKQEPRLRWDGEFLYIIDQTKLPVELVIEKQTSIEQGFDSIKQLKVRGAPAIGVAAAYLLLIGIRPYIDKPKKEFLDILSEKSDYLDSSSPTAVNLGYALKRMLSCSIKSSRYENVCTD